MNSFENTNKAVGVEGFTDNPEIKKIERRSREWQEEYNNNFALASEIFQDWESLLNFNDPKQIIETIEALDISQLDKERLAKKVLSIKLSELLMDRNKDILQAKLKDLSGELAKQVKPKFLLRVCAYCGKVLGEIFLGDSEARSGISHGACPICARRELVIGKFNQLLEGLTTIDV